MLECYKPGFAVPGQGGWKHTLWHPRAKCTIPTRPCEELPLNRREGRSTAVLQQGPFEPLVVP
eukprot:scaffold312_cov409-Pavlova_lutheri.AAC.16